MIQIDAYLQIMVIYVKANIKLSFSFSTFKLQKPKMGKKQTSSNVSLFADYIRDGMVTDQTVLVF